jgi:hypothetical protein
MRKLGSTHSIFFLASTEILGYITLATGIGSASIRSEHVVDWSIQETLAQLRGYASLWANQGFNFDDRNTSWEGYKKGRMSAEEFTKILREKESHTLEDLYGVRHVDLDSGGSDQFGLKEEIRGRYEEFGLGHSRSARMQEEQEREVAQEKEEKRQIVRPPVGVPRAHTMHHDVRWLVLTGLIPPKSPGILPAYHCLLHTTLEHFTAMSGRDAFPSIWITNDFMKTIVEMHDSTTQDDFLRPAEWILSSSRQPHLVLLSAFEANALMDDIRQSEFVTLHTYGARISRTTRSFEDLRSFMVPHRDDLPPFPSQVISELNLFAGQLYFESMDAYEETCRILGLYLKEVPQGLDQYASAIGVTGYVQGTEARKALGLRGVQFSDDPVECLRHFITLRCKRRGFLSTHLGQVLHGRKLYEIDFGECLYSPQSRFVKTNISSLIRRQLCFSAMCFCADSRCEPVTG